MRTTVIQGVVEALGQDMGKRGDMRGEFTSSKTVMEKMEYIFCVCCSAKPGWSHWVANFSFLFNMKETFLVLAVLGSICSL